MDKDTRNGVGGVKIWAFSETCFSKKRNIYAIVMKKKRHVRFGDYEVR